VAGIFSFFEDYDWQCESIPAPQSPAAPYVMKTVKRVSCPPTSQCSSYMGGGIMYPGYEEQTDSVIIAETLAETEDFFLSIQRYPNHPFQSLVTLTDHKSQTSRTMQIFNGSAQHCVPHNYSDAVGNATDSLSSYFAAYLGHESRPAEEFNLPWGNVTIPKRNVRAFRLQPREGVDGALPVPIDYDDDATTLLPTRLLFNGAEQMQLDVKEILVETLQQDAQAAALKLLRSINFICDSGIVQTPVMLSAVTENKDDVDFYAKLYDNSTEDLSSSYWIKAIEAEDAENLREESGARRLLSKRSSRNLGGISLDGGFDIQLSPTASIYGQFVSNCLTVGGEVQAGPSPWSLDGELSMGNCLTNKFSVAGEVGLKYGWSVEKKYTVKVWPFKAEINVECGLSIRGYIGGNSGSFKYDCGRRLESVTDWIVEDPAEIVSQFGAAGIGANHTLKAQHEADLNEIVTAGLDEEEDERLSEQDAADSVSTADGRRLFLDRRRRRRRRRRTCTKTGFEITAGVGVSGGCGITRRRLGVSLEGALDFTIGPWPSPLDDRAKATISAKACFKLGPFGGCVGLPTQTLFDMNI